MENIVKSNYFWAGAVLFSKLLASVAQFSNYSDLVIYFYDLACHDFLVWLDQKCYPVFDLD